MSADTGVNTSTTNQEDAKFLTKKSKWKIDEKIQIPRTKNKALPIRVLNEKSFDFQQTHLYDI